MSRRVDVGKSSSAGLEMGLVDVLGHLRVKNVEFLAERFKVVVDRRVVQAVHKGLVFLVLGRNIEPYLLPGHKERHLFSQRKV